jgi:3'(2'), 5'-bisphosphate nucleotidase
MDNRGGRCTDRAIDGARDSPGAAILGVNRGAMKVDGKSDGSPVTEADLAADRIIADGLARLAPQIPSLSEERLHQATPPYRGCFFLIDPLDGTKEFVAGRNEFTVNLALVSAGLPLLGLVGAPALGLLWRGLVGHGAERVTVADGVISAVAPIRTRPCPPRGKPWTVAVSRSHGDKRTEGFIAARPGAVRAELGSAVKFGQVAEGRVDIYPRLGPPRSGTLRRACRGDGGRRQGDGFEGAELAFGLVRRISSCRSSLPGGTLRRRRAFRPLMRQGAQCLRPVRGGLLDEAGRIGGKGGAVLLAAEQIRAAGR